MEKYLLEVAWGCPSEKYNTNGVFQFDQAKALKDIGHNIVFLALDIRSIRRWRKWGVNIFEKDGIEVFESNIFCGRMPALIKYLMQDISFYLGIRAIVNRYGLPECIHVHNVGQAISLSRFCQKNNVPYIITEHSDYIDENPFIEKRKRDTANSAASIITVGKRLAHDVSNKYDINPIVIGNIVDFSSIRFNPKSHEGITFISAASMVRDKGFDVLINSFSEFLKSFRNQYSPIQLVILGDGPDRKNIEKLVRDLNISDCVYFYGKYNKREFSSFLETSDVFILPSRHETFGIVYIEAMAAGVPVIATKCGGPEDFVDDSHGIMVPVDDVDALADAMSKITKNLLKYDKKAISEKIIEKYSSEKIAHNIEEVIKCVC